MTQALIINTDGTAEVKEIAREYPSINEALGGVDMIQAIFTPKGETFYMDEEGKYTGQEPNRFATSLFYSLGGQLFPGDYLAGPVAVFGPPDEDGYDTDVPERVLGDSLVRKAMRGEDPLA